MQPSAGITRGVEISGGALSKGFTLDRETTILLLMT